ncbi:nitrite reductase small subunit NirD [Xanthovirga aplysinae]|uniref:nitrite reductase small subunit NirD n=1 Tax=Xanthovirga aplysinae TaxID=2529853 RepID=UPI0012BD69C6|nr:nitrite reductase small subunit NirD [Xanthovirga aplysinae]MTI29972.1 nitrite reductase small subunit NirD [Xanthovirga aplysinae]
MLEVLEILKWEKAALEKDFPEDGGACVKLGDKQIAVFNFTSKGEWYATDNRCPHKKQMVLSRGIIGDKGGEPKVACPFHKRQFSLESGECLDDADCGAIKTYPIRVEDGVVYIAES